VLGPLLVEAGTRLRDLGACGIELCRLPVELGLARPKVVLSAIDLPAPAVELGGALLEIGLAPVQPSLPAGELRFLALVLSLDELSLRKASAQRVEAMLALSARLEFASDPPHARLEPLLALGELAFALCHLAGRVTQLPLSLGEVVERERAGAPRPLECLLIQLRSGLRRSSTARLPSHRRPRSTVAPEDLNQGIREQTSTLGLNVRIWAALATIYVVWGSTFLAIAIVVRDLPPFLSMALRHLVAGSLLFGWAWWRSSGGRKLGRREWGAAFVFGGALFLVGHGGLAWAQQDVPSGVAALLVGTIPLWFAILARVAFGEGLGGRALIGLLLGFAGLALLVDPSGEKGAEPIGALVIILGAFAWAAGSLWSRKLPLPRDTLLAAAMGMLTGGALLAIVSALGGEFDDARFTREALAATGYMVVVGSLIGFSAYVWLLKVAPASTVSTYAYVNPVIAVLLGWAFNDEVITGRTLVAGAAIVVGVALMVSRGTEREPDVALSSSRA
jgi:drug/metabolite transporter (DMT)-like permease